MRLILKPSTALVEPLGLPESGVLLPETARPDSVVGLVKKSACLGVFVGDRVLYSPRAGLRIKSDGARYLLLDGGDILARLV